MPRLPRPAREVFSRVVDPVRRGGPVVLWTPDDVNLGNFLYHWMRAHARQAAGEDVRALVTRPMEPWLDVFPRARSLVVQRSDVPFRSARVHGYWQKWDDGFTRENLTAFIQEVLLDGRFLLALERIDHGADLVLNVRRGDYYSVPRFRQRYAFDIVDYVSRALTISAERSPVGHVHVVSDDIAWCRAALDDVLLRRADKVTYDDPTTSALHDLAALAAAPRLVLANSTFSYWGGYISGILHPLGHADVVAPWFHARFDDHLAADQLDPAWRVVRDSSNDWSVPDE